jgi:chromosome segregation ATPase
MMYTCDDHSNAVVVYNGNRCPVCEIESEKDELDRKVRDLENDIDDLKDEKRDLQQQVDGLEIALERAQDARGERN